MGTFTVYFDGQFWVGLATRERQAATEVARVVFGSEPGEHELFEWARDHFHALVYIRVDRALGPLPKERATGNPKRRQREARKAIDEEGTRTRAQEAWQLAFETEKGVRQSEARAQRRELADERYARRVEKRKRAKRGK
jgi:hypothetical protein